MYNTDCIIYILYHILVYIKHIGNVSFEYQLYSFSIVESQQSHNLHCI